jgi:hypothetical protein
MSEELKMDGVTDDTEALGGAAGEEQVPRALHEAQLASVEGERNLLFARVEQLEAEAVTHVAEKQARS